jgi:hypothetical protein
MMIRFDVPQRASKSRVAITGDFLLAEPPIWQADLVREEVTVLERMAEPELGPECPDLLGRHRIGLQV